MEQKVQKVHADLGITDEDPVFEKGGYLVVNFDIYTFNEGKALS